MNLSVTPRSFALVFLLSPFVCSGYIWLTYWSGGFESGVIAGLVWIAVMATVVAMPNVKNI